jgi:hypothetical protein
VPAERKAHGPVEGERFGGRGDGHLFLART